MQSINQRFGFLIAFSLIVSLFFIRCSHAAPNQDKYLQIALLSLDPNQEPGGVDAYNGILKEESLNAIAGYQHWAFTVNQNGGIQVGSDNYHINLTVINIGNTTESQKNATQRAIDSGQFDFYFGPRSSGWNINVAEVCDQNNVLLLAGHASSASVFFCGSDWQTKPSCTALGARRFRRIYGVTPLSENAFRGPIALSAFNKAKTIAGWYVNDEFGAAVVGGGFNTAQVYGIDILGLDGSINPPQPLDAALTMSNSATPSDYDELVSKLKSINPDMIIGGTRARSCARFIAALKRANYMPKALMQSLCIYDPILPSLLAEEGASLEDARFVTDFEFWDARLKGPDYEDPVGFYFQKNGSISSPELFRRNWKEYHEGEEPDTVAPPLSFAMGYALQSTIQRFQTINSTIIEEGLKSLFMTSFYGKLAFNGVGQNIATESVGVQLGNNATLDIVSPLSALTAEYIYPVPTWEERKWEKKPFSTGAEITIAVIVAMAMLFSLLMALLTFIHRKNAAIIASSPLFLSLMIVGSLLIYSGIFTWTLTTSNVQCSIRWWLFGIGYILMFGGLLVKVWRISIIFNTKSVAIIKITNVQLLSVESVALLIEVICLIVLTVIAPGKALRIPTDPIRPKYDYMTCQTSKAENIMLIILAVYKGILILIGVYLSIKTWKVKFSMYNESRSVAFSMYNLFFFLAIAVIIQLTITNPDQRRTQFVVRSLAIVFGTLLPIIAIFGPTFTKAIHLDSEAWASNSNSKQMNSTKSTNSANWKASNKSYSTRNARNDQKEQETEKDSDSDDSDDSDGDK